MHIKTTSRKEGDILFQDLFEKLFNPCKHEEYEFVTNFYGDMINQVSPSNKIYRSLWKCRDCGKLKYSGKLNRERPYMVNYRNTYKEIQDLEQKLAIKILIK